MRTRITPISRVLNSYEIKAYSLRSWFHDFKSVLCNRAGLLTKTNISLVSYEFFEINIEFKWKQPATEKFSEISGFFQNLLTKCRFYTNECFTYILTCLLLPCLFSSTRFLNMCNPRATFCLVWWPQPGLRLYRNLSTHLLSWLRMVKAGWLGSMWSQTFLQMKFIIFLGFQL